MPSQMEWPHGTAEQQLKKVRTQVFWELGSSLERDVCLGILVTSVHAFLQRIITKNLQYGSCLTTLQYLLISASILTSNYCIYLEKMKETSCGKESVDSVILKHTLSILLIQYQSEQPICRNHICMCALLHPIAQQGLQYTVGMNGC